MVWVRAESAGWRPVVCWGGGVSERKQYPSDLSDEQWSLIEPVITAWKDRHRSVSGHQGAYAMREIVDAILYQGRTGCQWAYLPHDLPQKSATYYYFAAWRDDGTDEVIHELLRCQVRERARRLEDPTLVVLDTQSVHVAAGVPATTTGLDAGKRVPGRKRGLVDHLRGHVDAYRRHPEPGEVGRHFARAAAQVCDRSEARCLNEFGERRQHRA
jgi:transposase